MTELDRDDCNTVVHALTVAIHDNDRHLARLRAQRGTNAATTHAIERREKESTRLHAALAKIVAIRAAS